MGFFDFIKKAGGWIKDKVGGAFSVAKRIADGVKTVWHKATNIPVIGHFVRQAGEAVKNIRIPKTPITIGQALSGADKVIQTGNQLING